MRIDDNEYYDAVQRILDKTYNKTIFALKNKSLDLFTGARFMCGGNGTVSICAGVNGDELSVANIKKWKQDGTQQSKKDEVYNFIKGMKCQLLERGILCFDDCYFLAEAYIQRMPSIITILRKRFKYVFVDEAQDLQEHQLALIDRIFYSDDCVLQRVGDVNQSIYSRDFGKCAWTLRNPRTLNKSLRMTSEIASVVDAFMIHRDIDSQSQRMCVVEGVRQTSMAIPPYIIRFTREHMSGLEQRFSDLIDKYKLRALPEAKSGGFHIIGWNAKTNSYINKLRLNSIFLRNTKQSNDCVSLCDFINLIKETKSFTKYKQMILEVLCRLLKIANVTHDISSRTGKKIQVSFTPSTLSDDINNRSESVFKELNIIIFGTMKSLAANRLCEAYNLLKQFSSKTLLPLYKCPVNESIANFLGDGYSESTIQTTEHNQTGNGIFSDITIGTVHSVKGQTHCATMYVETFYSGYETQHLIKDKKKATKTTGSIPYKNPLMKERVSSEESDLTKRQSQAIRMMYVGFSRPTHLLCFACLKENMPDSLLSGLQEKGWVIEDL